MIPIKYDWEQRVSAAAGYLNNGTQADDARRGRPNDEPNDLIEQ